MFVKHRWRDRNHKSILIDEISNPIKDPQDEFTRQGDESSNLADVQPLLSLAPGFVLVQDCDLHDGQI